VNGLDHQELVKDRKSVLFRSYIRYEGKGIRIIFGPEIPVPESGDNSSKIAAMTQEVAKRFESELKKDPVDWHMLQRIWPDLG